MRNLALTLVLDDIASAYQGTSKANDKATKAEIRILSAKYGDKNKTCEPKLSICNHISQCSFIVNDGLCTIDSPVKNLEVVWDCGAGTEKHARAEGKGGRISIECK
jgi:hypothetical protein